MTLKTSVFVNVL